MHKGYLRLAVLLGALAVILGAFGAHGLKKIAPENAVAIFETGVRYQFYHVFAIALTAILWKEFPNKWIERAGVVFLIGIILFSGSIYTLTWLISANITGARWIGPLTPTGGIFLIAGWLCLAMGIKAETKKPGSPQV
ncbi:DUF423 domain-containing protein [Filimonas effusa]|uniref:DUF423 domain-containing protein n=1 Tax=Filimonas effusa TaxID=2508721 RepID=A0A4Q1D7L8_9BACT|nr:DUF423 domain-containing protein [Filimonas effusa]RXK85284.1 DUF423 domain-containing protein [Filimonas effusa]